MFTNNSATKSLSKDTNQYQFNSSFANTKPFPLNSQDKVQNKPIKSPLLSPVASFNKYFNKTKNQENHFLSNSDFGLLNVPSQQLPSLQNFLKFPRPISRRSLFVGKSSSLFALDLNHNNSNQNLSSNYGVEPSSYNIKHFRSRSNSLFPTVISNNNSNNETLINVTAPDSDCDNFNNNNNNNYGERSPSQDEFLIQNNRLSITSATFSHTAYFSTIDYAAFYQLHYLESSRRSVQFQKFLTYASPLRSLRSLIPPRYTLKALQPNPKQDFDPELQPTVRKQKNLLQYFSQHSLHFLARSSCRYQVSIMF